MKSTFKQLHHTASTHFEPGKTTQNTQLHSLLHTTLDDLHKLARKSGVDGPKQQPVQHHHNGQPDQMLAGGPLPADDNYVGRLETFTGWVREVGLP